MANEKDPKAEADKAAAEAADAEAKAQAEAAEAEKAAAKAEQQEKRAAADKAGAAAADAGDVKDGSAALQKKVVAENIKSGGAPREDDDDAPVVLRAGQSGEIPTGDQQDGDALVTIEKDVVVEFFPENAKRPSHVQLFTKGQVVRRSQIDAAMKTYVG